LIERDRSDVITQTEQVADGGYGTVVYQLSKLAVLLVITTAYGILNGAHYVRVDHVVFATVDELQQTTLLDAFTWQPCVASQFFLIVLQMRKVRAADAAGRIREAK